MARMVHDLSHGERESSPESSFMDADAYSKSRKRIALEGRSPSD